MYYVYIVRCRDDTLYTGITTDLARRCMQHRGERPGGAKYTHARPATALEGAWRAEDRSAASRLEAAIKRLTRPEKLSLLRAPASLAPDYQPLDPRQLAAAWGAKQSENQ